MTNQELEAKLTQLVREERRITKQILELIREAANRRLYLERGFASLFDWLVQGFGYSQSAAYRRIQAARLIEAVPDASEKITTGEVNLTTLAQVQTAIRQEEKRSGTRVSAETKREIIQKIEGKSSDETRKVLSEALPDSKPITESLRIVSNDEARLVLTLTENSVEELKRCRELLSHKMPDASWSEIVAFLASTFVAKNDQQRKTTVVSERKSKTASESTSAAVSPRAKAITGGQKKSASTKKVSRSVRRFVLSRAGYACEYVDAISGRRCGSRFKVEVDHVQPKAFGGTDDVANLRCLCRQHNLLAAERALGRKKMQRYRHYTHEV